MESWFPRLTTHGDKHRARADGDWLRESVLYPALDTAEIERKPRQHGFHLFRHTCGSIVYALTGDIRLAKDALAHSRISATSDIYVHTDEVPDPVRTSSKNSRMTQVFAMEEECLTAS